MTGERANRLKPAPADPGLRITAAAATSVSEVDPANGVFSYRGFEVGELVRTCSFDEVAYLLLYGVLPVRDDFDRFMQEVSGERQLPGAVFDVLRRLPANASLSDALRIGVSWLGVLDPAGTSNEPEANLRKSIRLFARLPTLAVNAFLLSQGRKAVDPGSGLSHCANIFQMLTGQPRSDSFARLLDVSQILYAEHGLNASTFAARVAVSTCSDLYAAIAAALAAHKGALHGGAVEDVARMLTGAGKPGSARDWVLGELEKGRRIPGFGLRHHTCGDVRAEMMWDQTVELAAHMGERSSCAIAREIRDAVHSEKGLLPNIDFPAALAFYLMKFPIALYTSLFATARIVGWCAHVMEQSAQDILIHPRAVYTGKRGCRVLPMNERTKPC